MAVPRKLCAALAQEPSCLPKASPGISAPRCSIMHGVPHATFASPQNQESLPGYPSLPTCDQDGVARPLEDTAQELQAQGGARAMCSAVVVLVLEANVVILCWQNVKIVT